MTKSDMKMERRGTMGNTMWDTRPKIGKEDLSTSETKSARQVLQELLPKAAKITDWKSHGATSQFRTTMVDNECFGVKGDKFLHELIQAEGGDLGSVWENEAKPSGEIQAKTYPGELTGLGKKILIWMLNDTVFRDYFRRTPSDALGEDDMSGITPIAWAIQKSHYGFLACLMNIYCDKPLGLKESIDRVLEFQNKEGQNAIHLAVSSRIPFAPFLAYSCSAKALKAKNGDGRTPMHLALNKKTLKKNIPSGPCRDASSKGWSDNFSPKLFLEMLAKRSDDNLMEAILTNTDNCGASLVTECSRTNLDKDLTSRLKELVFKHVKKVSDVSRALYGANGNAKELCLDMSDFNQSSHDFEAFVRKLREVDREVLEFEETLLFVHLPDLNYVKQPCPPGTISKLFVWLKNCGVKTIRTLSIPDNTTEPLSDAFVQKYVVDVFKIEELNWRKLDINLDILTNTRHRADDETNGNSDYFIPSDHLTNLKLYSSGNWSILYHWISGDGLAKLQKLQKVSIDIVLLNPTKDYHDDATRSRHQALAEEYQHRLEDIHKQRFESHASTYKLDVSVDSGWDYVVSTLESDETATQVLQHPFAGQLGPCLNALSQWESHDSMTEVPKTPTDLMKKGQMSRFRRFALAPEGGRKDERIKVAIIDNGADRIRFRYRDMIAKGQSYVSADLLGSDRLLPWWMVSDPHGTQMASLIGQTNRYCRLYVARVGRGRNDIQPEAAASAIHWAIENQVDIISISWTLQNPNNKLNDAIKEAWRKNIIIFCSTADEGMLTNSAPVGDPNHVLVVSATDKWGQLTSKGTSNQQADICIPGENISAPGPYYMGNVNQIVSGSSVATALAAGITSLALLMMKTFNPKPEEEVNDGDDGIMSDFHTRDGIRRVIKRMAVPGPAIKLTDFFPITGSDHNIILQKLADIWQPANFK